MSRTVWVDRSNAAEAERDHDPPWLLVGSNEHPVADRRGLVGRGWNSSDDSAPCLGESPPDHRRIVKRQRSRSRLGVRPVHGHLGVHAPVAFESATAVITSDLSAAAT
jgi:hypothetical protein